MEPPYGVIADTLLAGEVIPFLGAGASLGETQASHWHIEDARRLPSGTELADYLKRKANFPAGEAGDLAMVAQYLEVTAGRKGLATTLRPVFEPKYEPQSLHHFLAKQDKALLMVTTNYDDLLERAFEAAGRAYDLVVHATDPKVGGRLIVWNHGSEKPEWIPPNKLDLDLTSVSIIYKIHGTFERHQKAADQFVITEDDYVEFVARTTRSQAIPAIFAEPFEKRNFLFLGYGLKDWNMRVVLHSIQKKRNPDDIKSWAIQRNPSPLEIRLWENRGVNVFNVNISEFVEKLRAERPNRWGNGV